jgi:ELWxxDGT repeat protein
MKTLFTIAAITAILTAQASGNFSLIEINPLHGSEAFLWSDSAKNVYGAGELSSFTEMDGKLYFSARNAFDNDELWVTDGKSQSTELVAEINPHGNGYIGNLVRLGNRILFMASDNGTDFDLWSSDGKSTGTSKIVEMNQTWNGSLFPQNVAVFGNQLIFCSETQLMVTDGTAAGTDSLMAITQYTQGFGYCELNGFVYFILPNSNWESEIWRTNGTTMGTQKMLNLKASPLNIQSTTQMLSFGGKLYLIAAGTGFGNNVFTYDGNVNGQVQLVDIAQGGSAYPSPLTVHNGALYFSASNMSSVNMYRITTNNPVPQALMQNPSISWMSSVTFANNSVYFLTENQQDIHRIDLNSLAYSVTHLPGYNIPYYWGDGTMLVGTGGMVYFAAYDSFNTQQFFFESDEALQNIQVKMPQSTTTTHPFNLLLSCGMIDVFDFKIWNNKVVVPANFNDAGREIWVFDTEIVNGIPQEETANASFSVFPNPANNEVSVSSEGTGYCDKQQHVLLTNIAGEICLNTEMIGSNTSLSLATLSAGNYFVSLVEEGKAIGTKKLVIMK